MRISYIDRIQAIKFSPLYRKDYQQYVKQRDKDGEFDLKIGSPWDPRRYLSTAGKWLCQKWGLHYPIGPDAPVEPYKPVKMPSSDLKQWMIDGAVYPVSFPIEDELKKPTLFGSGGQKVVTHLSGKLCLLIDTSLPPNMIMDVLKEFIEYHVKKTKGRSKETKEKQWEIYTLYQKKKNLLKIAQELHGFSEVPSYDQDADKYYRRVERAYKKALKMIACVEKEAKQKNSCKKIPPPTIHSK